MIRILELAQELQEFCDGQRWKNCLIGGIAVQYWGEARVTRDVDLQLLTGFGEEAGYVTRLLERFAGRLSDAKEFAMQNRVLLLKSEDGVGIDITLAGLPYEAQIVERAQVVEYGPGVRLRICSAEDLLVMKVFAGRAIDIRDAESVAMRFGRELDWDYVMTHAEPLLEVKEEQQLLTVLSDWRTRFGD